MFYRHWKKILLAALALFWGGCEYEDDAIASYGCFPTKCYNTTAVNDAGKVFDIIECENGEKYLRQPGHYAYQEELQKELPEGVYTYGHVGECGATNCKYGPKTCVSGTATDYLGNPYNYDSCDPIIECPEK